MDNVNFTPKPVISQGIVHILFIFDVLKKNTLLKRGYFIQLDGVMNLTQRIGFDPFSVYATCLNFCENIHISALN